MTDLALVEEGLVNDDTGKGEDVSVSNNKTKSRKRSDWFIGFIILLTFLIIIYSFVLEKRETKVAPSLNSNAEVMDKEYLEKEKFQNFRNNLEQDIELIRNEIDGIKKTVNDVDASIADINTKLSIFKSLESKIVDDESLLSRLSSNVEEIFFRLGALEIKKKEEKRVNDESRFKYVIDGVGTWDGMSFISIATENRHRVMYEGEIIGKWKLLEINSNAKLVIFKNQINDQVVKRKI